MGSGRGGHSRRPIRGAGGANPRSRSALTRPSRFSLTRLPTTPQVRPATTPRTRVVAAAAAPNADRRAFLAGVASVLVAGPAAAIDLFDDRKAKDTGFDIIYEARDLDLPQAERDGLNQFRGSLDATKKRIKESEARIDTKLPGFVEKKYWTLAREELRGQLGNLRFDLDTVAETLGKDGKKKALAAKADFLKAADTLDFAIRKKDADKANAALAATRAALDAALAALG